MLFVSLLRWWYGEGLLRQWQTAGQRLARTADYFSIGLLLKTLFSPFKQISAGRAQGPLAVKWHAWVDRMVSRAIGAVFRLFTIIAGVVALALSLLFASVRLLGWLAVPLLPVVGLFLSIAGWLPWR